MDMDTNICTYKITNVCIYIYIYMDILSSQTSKAMESSCIPHLAWIEGFV
jgi:hypothetical protein